MSNPSRKYPRQLLRTIDEWCAALKRANEIAPTVAKLREEVRWEVGVFEQLPPEADNVSSTGVDEQSRIALEAFQKRVPAMPPYSKELVCQISSTTSNTASVTVSFLSRVTQLESPAARQYGLVKLQEYFDMQAAHKRPEEVRQLIDRHIPLLLPRFDQAYDTVGQFVAGVSTDTAAANDMRNLVDGLQGQLYERARHAPKEIMTLRLVAQREGFMNVTVIHEVWTDSVGAQLGLQWCRYSYPSPVLYGYRFVWRDDQGRTLPEGRSPITRAAFMFELIQKATDPEVCNRRTWCRRGPTETRIDAALVIRTD